MKLRHLVSVLALGSAVALAGCNSSDVLNVAQKANQPLPEDVVRKMQAQGMTKSSPVMMRIFKQEAVLEVWKKKDTGRYALVKTYEICKFSGGLGPKFKEGDRQSPEGFYFVNRGQMNPNSSYYLSFDLGFPNKYDRSHGRYGTNLMVHGDCSSAGCYAMTDQHVSEIYAFAREAHAGGQEAFQVQAFPFRMTAENMAKNRNHEYFDYWKMLKVGYDHFELTNQPPKVDVCEKRYVINQNAVDGTFNAAAACPKMEQPYALELSYTKMQNGYLTEFENIVAKLEGRAPTPVSLLPLPIKPVEVAPVEVAPTPTPAPATITPLTVEEEVNVNAPTAPTVAAPAPVIATSSGSGLTAQSGNAVPAQ
ncbi:MAG: murein L,D-transpeptidase family protein [Ahrensia sp.]|nr:murein L,D-transpeptidase family protein [Ahrensia sp.]